MVKPDVMNFFKDIKIIVLVSGWNAISNQELPRIPHRTRKSDDEIIIINISGCRFMCWKSTLEVRP